MSELESVLSEECENHVGDGADPQLPRVPLFAARDSVVTVCRDYLLRSQVAR